MPDKKVNIHIVSDSSGQTALHVCNSVISQFENIQVSKFMWPMVRTKQQIDNIMKNINIAPGIVIYTIVNYDLRRYLKDLCATNNIKSISAIATVVSEFSDFIGIKSSKHIPGSQHHVIDDEYNRRIEAMDFSLSHDDGQMLKSISEAEIILIGVSRTSKSPTSIYLAQRGYKTANIPFVKDIGIPIQLSIGPTQLMVGLTIDPMRLKQIRTTRLASLGKDFDDTNSYTNLKEINDEIIQARRFFDEYKIPVIDVTGKAVEETCAEILNIYFEKIGVNMTRS